MPFNFTKQSIPDVILVQPVVFEDERGFFMETYKESEFKKNGVNFSFNQDNHSRSNRGVLRGLHYQLEPDAQGKLVRVVAGSIFDVAVDIRRGSPTFGHYVAHELSSQNRTLFWIPPGFAHGFLVLEDNTEVLYKTSGEYNPALERGIRYDDPEINIPWPNPGEELIISEKDQKLPGINEAEYNFTY